MPSDRAELDVVGAFVDAAYLAVPIELLLYEVLGEPHAAHPVDALDASDCHQETDIIELIITQHDFTSNTIGDEHSLNLPQNSFRSRRMQTNEMSVEESSEQIDCFMCNRGTFGSISIPEVQEPVADRKLTKTSHQEFCDFSSIDSDEKLNLLCGVYFEVFNLLLKLLPETKVMKISRETVLDIRIQTGIKAMQQATHGPTEFIDTQIVQGDYIRHPVIYELSHKYGLPTENLIESQLPGKLEELKEIIRREIRKELKIKEGAEKLRGVSTDRRSLSHVATIVKNSNWKLTELKNELSELESQIILFSASVADLPKQRQIQRQFTQQNREFREAAEYRTESKAGGSMHDLADNGDLSQSDFEPPLDERIEDLKHRLRVETAVVEGAKNVVRLLQNSSKDKGDKKALTEPTSPPPPPPPQQWSVHAEFTISHPGLETTAANATPGRTDTVHDDKGVRMSYDWSTNGTTTAQQQQQQQDVKYGFQRGNICFTSTPPRRCSDRLGVPDSDYGSDLTSPASAVSSSLSRAGHPYNRKCRSTCNIVLSANVQHELDPQQRGSSACGRTQSLRCQTPTLCCDRKSDSFYGCGDPWCHHLRYGDEFSCRDVSVQTYDMVNKCTSPLLKMEDSKGGRPVEKKAGRLKRGRVLRHADSPKWPASPSTSAATTPTSGGAKEKKASSGSDKFSDPTKPRTIHIDVYCTGTEMESDSSSSSSSETSRSKTASTPQTVYENKNLSIIHKKADDDSIPHLLRKRIEADRTNNNSLDKVDSDVDDTSTAYPTRSSFSSLGYSMSSMSSFPNSTPYSMSSCTIPGVDSFATTSWKDTVSDFGSLLNSHSSIAPNDSIYFVPRRIEEESEDRSVSNGTVSSLQPTDSFEYANSEDRLRIKRMEKVWTNKIHSRFDRSPLTKNKLAQQQQLQDDVNRRLSKMNATRDSDTDVSDDDDEEKGWTFVKNVDKSVPFRGSTIKDAVPVKASFTVPKSSVARAFEAKDDHLPGYHSDSGAPPSVSPHPTAQESLRASSMKLDLLKKSLELRRTELPDDSPVAIQLKEELANAQTLSHTSPMMYTTVTGTLEVRLMGCQDLLEDVPGRPKKDIDANSSPMDLRFFKKTSRSSSKSYSIKEEVSEDIMAVLKLDNNTVAQTNWRPCSQQAWDQRFSIELDKSRELEIGIYWRDWRSLCAVKFLKLEEFIDDERHGMALHLEPQGLLFAEIKFLNPMISKRPKLQRQKKIFKQVMPRAKQMNINIVTWGRWMKQASRIPSRQTLAFGSTENITDELTVDDKPETPGETPDPCTVGLGGQRPLGLIGLTPPPLPSTQPPLPPPPPSQMTATTPIAPQHVTTPVSSHVTPPPIHKKRTAVTPPPSVAALKEFDFLEEQETPRPGPLLIPSTPSTPSVPPDQLVPPSPQPVIEFPDDEPEPLAALNVIRRPPPREQQCYRDSAYESKRQSQQYSNLNIEHFRLISVLGRGHFGKVILSQYKNTGE
nr:unnamed protein product [Callosobruchus analis]